MYVRSGVERVWAKGSPYMRVVVWKACGQKAAPERSAIRQAWPCMTRESGADTRQKLGMGLWIWLRSSFGGWDKVNIDRRKEFRYR